MDPTLLEYAKFMKENGIHILKIGGIHLEMNQLIQLQQPISQVEAVIKEAERNVSDDDILMNPLAGLPFDPIAPKNEER